jgi:hypothetical protein
MPPIIQIDPHGYTPLAPDVYEAALTEIAETKVANRDVFRLKFVITEGKFKSSWLYGLIGRRSKARHSKLGQLLYAFGCLERALLRDFELNEIIGKECCINVERRENCNAIVEYFPLSEIENLKRNDRA